jgi:hypothetical protein
MTQTRPDSLQVRRENWDVVTSMAKDAGRTTEVFIEEGVMATLGAARMVLANRRAGRGRTLVLIGRDEQFRMADDLELVFRDCDKESEAPDCAVLDPFTSEERVSFDLPAELLSEARRVSELLEVSFEGFMQVAIDVRHVLRLAEQKDQLVLVETPVRDTYNPLPTRFSA